MAYDTTYIGLRLMRCGLWDEALALLPPDTTAGRAEVLTDRFWWRLDGQAETEQAVAALYGEDGPSPPSSTASSPTPGCSSTAARAATTSLAPATASTPPPATSG